MSAQSIYIVVAIGALALITIFWALLRGKKQQAKMSPLATAAFILVIFGAFFGEHRLVGYSIMGLGVLLAIADIAQKSKK
jgi:sterol desaturase/sphingolipid hydroxylase (fatty acid hydroxylase superfamily)